MMGIEKNAYRLCFLCGKKKKFSYLDKKLPLPRLLMVNVQTRTTELKRKQLLALASNLHWTKPKPLLKPVRVSDL